MLGERSAQRLKERGDSVVLAIAERQSQGKFTRTGQVQLSRECDVAVGCAIELPVHLKVAGQVCPAIAPPYVAT